MHLEHRTSVPQFNRVREDPQLRKPFSPLKLSSGLRVGLGFESLLHFFPRVAQFEHPFPPVKDRGSNACLKLILQGFNITGNITLCKKRNKNPGTWGKYTEQLVLCMDESQPYKAATRPPSSVTLKYSYYNKNTAKIMKMKMVTPEGFFSWLCTQDPGSFWVKVSSGILSLAWRK